MKKILFTCFLGYLCPPKSKLIPNWFTDFFCCIGTIFPRHWRDIFIPKFRDYLTEGISPLIGGLFHRRSRSISRHSKNYLSDKGAVFRQPQADISQKRSDFISQAEGLCISNSLNQKWFVKTFLILSLLLSSINEVSSQVADPPGADLLHKSSSHRSGETRSDTFFSVTAQDIDGGPGLQPARCGGSSVFSLQSQKVFSLVDSDQDMRIGLENSSFQSASVSVFGIPILSDRQDFPQKPKTQSLVSYVLGLDTSTSLVDNSISLGQGGVIPSAPSGALIYGEIINPDSLGPIQLTFTPYYLDPKSAFLRQEFHIVPSGGEFFDGVMNPMSKKFTVELDQVDRPGYFSLDIKNRPILENYLISPGDSLKISIDLSLMDVLFAGKHAAFYEAQYAIKREQKRMAFNSPRQLVTSRDTPMLQKPENIAKMEKFKGQFGAEMLILEPGTESLDYLLAGLENPGMVLESQLKILGSFADRLSSEQYDLLKAKIYCDLYAGAFSTYRKFYHPMVERKFEETDRELYRERIQKLVDSAKGMKFLPTTQLVSLSFLEMALETTILTGIWERRPFLDVVEVEYLGEVADRLRAGYLSHYLTALRDGESIIPRFLEATHSSPWKERITNLKRSHVPGDQILPIDLLGLDGREFTRDDLLGRPTLLYFYFSTCSHSANYFQEYLFPLYQDTKELDYQLIAISVDKDPELWKSRIDKYSDASILNLNLRGDDLDKWVSYYEIYGYPKTMMLDQNGRILSFDIRKAGMTYESFRGDFLDLYKSAVPSSTFSAPNL
jgi:peroxiredoxin